MSDSTPQGKSMTREQLAEFITKTVSDALGKDLGERMREHMQAMVKQSVEPAVEMQKGWLQDMRAQIGAPAARPETRDPGMALGAIVRAAARCAVERQPFERVPEFMKGWGYEKEADILAVARTKALAASEPISGGVLVPEQLAADVVQFLRPASAVRPLNPAVVPMPTGTVRVPKITAGSNAYYIGENANATKTQPTFGQIVLTWKKLAALVPVSNDLIRYALVGADAMVRDDLAAAIAQRENQAFIRDDGTNGTPKGLRHWVPGSNVLTANATVSLANSATDLGRCVLALENANVPMIRPGWIISPRTRFWLSTIQNANGYFAYRDEIMAGRLWGWPYRTTTQVPSNLGAGTSSEIYLVDFADAVIGESQRLMIDASTEAAYHDGSAVVAAFSQDQTVIRAIAEHDFAMRRDVSVAVLTDVTWGS